MRKAFGMSFIKQVFLVLACLYGAQFFTGLFAAIDCGPPPVAVGPMGGVASSDVDSTDVAAAKTYDTCMIKARGLAARGAQPSPEPSTRARALTHTRPRPLTWRSGT